MGSRPSGKLFFGILLGEGSLELPDALEDAVRVHIDEEDCGVEEEEFESYLGSKYPDLHLEIGRLTSYDYPQYFLSLKKISADWNGEKEVKDDFLNIHLTDRVAFENALNEMGFTEKPSWRLGAFYG